MGLVINRINGLIGIERTPSRLEIRIRNATLELKTHKARVSIQSEKPKVLIDQYEARASAGLKNTADRTREISQRAYQRVMEFIEKKAADGDMLAAIEYGGNPIAEIAARDSWPQYESNIDFIPKTGPRFDVTGSLKIEWNVDEIARGVEGRYIPGRVDIYYRPSVVRIYMRQYPSIKFQYIEDARGSIGGGAGRVVDIRV